MWPVNVFELRGRRYNSGRCCERLREGRRVYGDLYGMGRVLTRNYGKGFWVEGLAWEKMQKQEVQLQGSGGKDGAGNVGGWSTVWKALCESLPETPLPFPRPNPLPSHLIWLAAVIEGDGMWSELCALDTFFWPWQNRGLTKRGWRGNIIN